MNSATLNSIPKPGMVAFRLKLDLAPQVAGIAPPGNWIGRAILGRLLGKALAGLLTEPHQMGTEGSQPVVPVGFELNRAVMMASVSDRAAALNIIIAELKALGLLAAAHLVWFDEQEGIWRTHRAGWQAADLPQEAYLSKEFIAEVEAASEQTQAALALALQGFSEGK